MIKKDYYKILQIDSNASTEEINKAYKILAEQYHPKSPQGNILKYKDIKEAYEVLVNSSKRKEYDVSRQKQKIVDLPPVFPVIQPKKISLQSFINLIYEQINYETFNHNPTKSRIYEQIYEELISKKSEIEAKPYSDNPIWKILKTYQPYLILSEYNSLKLMASNILNITEEEADQIMNKVEISDIPYKKYLLIVFISFFIAIIVVSFVYFTFVSPKNKTHLTDLQNVSVNTDESSDVVKVPGAYYAKIYDIGLPVNIRSASTTEWDNIVAKIPQNESVEVDKIQSNGWYYIKKGNIEGYVYGGLLQDNEYPDAFPIVQVIPGEIKVFDKKHNLLRIFRSRDRFVVFYHDNENYYVKTEKGNLVGIEKESVLLENPRKIFIPYIGEEIKDTVKYFAVMIEQVIVEETVSNDDIDETIKPEEEIINEDVVEEDIIKEEEPEIVFPGQDTSKEGDINSYVTYVKTKVLQNWHVSSGLSSYSAIVVFRISRDGRLINLNLVKSSGVKEVDDASMKAINISAPFKSIPDNYDGNFIDIKFNFDEG